MEIATFTLFAAGADSLWDCLQTIWAWLTFGVKTRISEATVVAYCGNTKNHFLISQNQNWIMKLKKKEIKDFLGKHRIN